MFRKRSPFTPASASSLRLRKVRYDKTLILKFSDFDDCSSSDEESSGSDVENNDWGVKDLEDKNALGHELTHHHKPRSGQSESNKPARWKNVFTDYASDDSEGNKRSRDEIRPLNSGQQREGQKKHTRINSVDYSSDGFLGKDREKDRISSLNSSRRKLEKKTDAGRSNKRIKKTKKTDSAKKTHKVRLDLSSCKSSKAEADRKFATCSPRVFGNHGFSKERSRLRPRAHQRHEEKGKRCVEKEKREKTLRLFGQPHENILTFFSREEAVEKSEAKNELSL